MRAGDIEGRVEVRTASGDVRVRRSGGELSANLVSGDLSVDDAAAGLDVTTVSGDVEVRAAGGGGIRVQAVSGDVQLGIKPGERLYIDASSVSGTMSSELGLEDSPPTDSIAPGERAAGAHDQRRSEDRAGRCRRQQLGRAPSLLVGEMLGEE